MARGQQPASQAETESREREAAWIRAAQQGDSAAFDQLVRAYDQPVLRLALRLTGSPTDAQDIYQEAFLKAYRYLPRFRFECSFYTWLYRIVTNLCLDQMRRRKVRKEESSIRAGTDGGETDLLQQVSDDRSGADPHRELERQHAALRIAAALETLTPRERIVFELKHFEGLRLRAIGDMLQTSEETAKNTLFRATKKLRGHLAPLRS